MESLERLEELAARVSICHNADVLGGFAENDVQARRDLTSISLLLKSLTDDAKARALAAESLIPPLDVLLPS
jgi:hypothetical protein